MNSGIKGRNRIKIATMTNTLQHLFAITGTLENDEVRKWKKQGGKVMGYLCSTIPEEMSIQPSWSAGSAAATERSRGKRSGFPLPVFTRTSSAGMIRLRRT